MIYVYYISPGNEPLNAFLANIHHNKKKILEKCHLIFTYAFHLSNFYNSQETIYSLH